MPNSVDENTLRVSFTILEKQITQMLRFKGKITPNKTATKTAKKKCFLVFSTKSEKIAIQQSHIINPLLTSFARSVRESIAFGFYRTDCTKPQAILLKNEAGCRVTFAQHLIFERLTHGLISA